MSLADLPTTAWLEVTLTLDDAALAEAVAEVLARFTPRPVAWEYTSPRTDARNHIVDLGPVTLRAYLPLAEGHAEALRQRLEAALRAWPNLPPPRFRSLQPEDWATAWKRAYRPQAVGQRLAIVPAWLPNPWPERLAIFIEPGMAFGTGMHATTRLVLAEVELLAPHVQRVVDVGCGSGILSLAALRLGAGHAVGVDTDPLAVEAAQANAARNALQARFTVRQGSLEALQAPDLPFATGQLVLANILAPVLVDLLHAGLGQVVEPKGHLVLSGILADQAAAVEEAARTAGLRPIRQRREEEWVALTFRRVSP